MSIHFSEYYYEFLQEAMDTVARLEELSEQHFRVHSRQFSELYRDIHTLKGNCVFIKSSEHPQIPALKSFIELFESYLTKLSEVKSEAPVDPAALLIVADILSNFLATQMYNVPAGYKRAIEFLESILPQDPAQEETQQQPQPEAISTLWSVIYLNLSNGNISDMLDILNQSIVLRHFSTPLAQALSQIATVIHNTARTDDTAKQAALRVACDHIFCFTISLVRSGKQRHNYQTFVKMATQLLTTPKDDHIATTAKRKTIPIAH